MGKDQEKHYRMIIYWSWSPKTLKSSSEEKPSSSVGMLTLMKKEKNIPFHCLYVCVPSTQENPGFQFRIGTQVCPGMQGSRHSQVKILTLHKKEGKTSQPTELKEVRAKGDAERYMEWRRANAPCWHLQDPSKARCHPVFESTCHIVGTWKSWRLQGRFGLFSNSLKKWRELFL